MVDEAGSHCRVPASHRAPAYSTFSNRVLIAPGPAHQRFGEPGRRVLLHDACRALGAEHALVHRMVAIALDEADLAFFERYLDPAATRTHVTGRELRLLLRVVFARDGAAHEIAERVKGCTGEKARQSRPQLPTLPFPLSPSRVHPFGVPLTRLSRSRPHQPLPAAAGAAPSLTGPWAARQPSEAGEASCSAPGARGSARGAPLRRRECRA